MYVDDFDFLVLLFIVFIGAGIAGVCTAYQLGKRGYVVTVIDSADNPGTQCSAVPAGGMQKSNPTIDRDSWVAVMSSWKPLYSIPEDKFFHRQMYDEFM